MNSKFYFLSLLLLVLFSAQTSFAIEPTVEELRSMGPAGLQADDPVRRRDQPPHRQSFARL